MQVAVQEVTTPERQCISKLSSRQLLTITSRVDLFWQFWNCNLESGLDLVHHSLICIR